MGERNDLIERLIRASKKAYDEPDGQGIEMADLLARAFTTIATLSEALAEAEKKGADEKDEAVRMRVVLEVLVMQRDRHFHTAKAWDEARAVLRAYSKDSSDGE